MNIKLLVEYLNPDKSFGYTTNVEVMKQNANIIRIENIRDIKELFGLVFIAGRYLASVLLDENNEYAMIYIDLKKELKNLLSAPWFLYLSDEQKQLYIKHFMKLKDTYDRDYNAVELVTSLSDLAGPELN